MQTTIQLDVKEIHKTPKGEAVWPHLITPQTKFDPAGVYSIGVKFSTEDESKFLADMTELYEAAYVETLRKESRAQLPRETPPWKLNEKDAKYEFKFKLKAGGVFNGEAWENSAPKLFDAGKQVIEDENLKIGNGSIVRVYFQVRPYFVQKAGISLRLKAVQIYKLVAYDDASRYGLEAEDDGYRYEAPKKPTQPAIPLLASSVITDADIPF